MKKTNVSLCSFLSWLTLSGMLVNFLSPLTPAMSLSKTSGTSSAGSKNRSTSIKSNESAKEIAEKSLNNSKITFEENRGQFDKTVGFVMRRANQAVFLTAKEVIFTLPAESSANKSLALKMKLNKANYPKPVGLNSSLEKVNYLRGNDSAKWQTGISLFDKVKYQEVYKGIDLIWYGNDANELEYDFVVKPRANYRQIEMTFENARKLEINKNGDLLIRTTAGILQQRKPFTYQNINGAKKEIASRYKLTGKSTVRFIVGDYDQSKELVIDPAVMPYSTYLGGTGGDLGNDIAVDNQGNIYVVGTTRSANFPTSSQTIDATINGTGDDIAVTKFNANGALVYSTFIGGTTTSGERATGIAVDGAGNAYIVGSTTSADFPVTSGAFSQTKKGGSSASDVFVAKLNASGSALIYSTFLGGLADEEGNDIAVDSNGNANVVGKTNSYSTTVPANAFPVTANGLAAPNAGGFYAKLNPSGSALVYSTYLSGSSDDEARKVVTDTADNVYVMGVTSSTNFPVTGGAFDTTYNGGGDIFVAKFSGSNLQYSTYLGGNSYEGINNGFGLAVDRDGNCYVMGPAISDDFPTTPGALDRTRNNYEAFVAKLNPQGSALVFSTFLSPLNNGSNYGYALAVDSQSNVYVLGKTGSEAFAGISCYVNRFIAQIAPDGSAFKNVSCYSEGFGDSQAMVIDAANNLYTTGYTYSDYPTTANAFDKTQNGSDDIVVTKHRFVNTAIKSDFDGDGKSDPSVYRDGTLHLLRSSAGYKGEYIGLPGDVQTPADFDGDGKTDAAFWRAAGTEEATFYIFQSSDGTVRTEKFGATGDDPTVVGDYDGDGKADVATYRNAAAGQQSYFYYRGSKDNPGKSITYTAWGMDGDKPVVGDYNADGKLDFAVFRPAQGVWYILNNENVFPQNWRAEQFGLPTDKLVQADYDGDAKTDIAVFRPSSGVWYIKQSSVPAGYYNVVRYEQWGLGTDTLVPADYDGDGKADIAVWRNGHWYIKQSSSNSANLGTIFGLPDDKPIQSYLIH